MADILLVQESEIQLELGEIIAKNMAKSARRQLGGCYPPWPSASADNTLLDLLNSSYPTQPHSLIAK